MVTQRLALMSLKRRATGKHPKCRKCGEDGAHDEGGGWSNEVPQGTRDERIWQIRPTLNAPLACPAAGTTD
jgi:hypothetical protein